MSYTTQIDEPSNILWIPQGQREEVKQKFNNIRNEIITS